MSTAGAANGPNGRTDQGGGAAGGCRCGAVRYTVATPARTYACHCRDCQTSSGSAFALQLPVMDAAFIVKGETREWTIRRDDGETSTHYFCATCLCRLFNRNTARPGLVIVRAGTLDESDALAPVLHVWTSRKQPWIALPEDVPAWPESALVAAFMPLFAGV